jgi:hypothetical protein
LPAPLLVSGFLSSHVADSMRQLEIVVGETARGMGGENQGHLVPADVDVWMVIHQLRLMSDLIHEVQGRDKVRELIRRGDCRVIALGAAPVRKSSQLLGHLGISQQWAHSTSQGAAAAGVKSAPGPLAHRITSSGTTGPR